MGEKNVHNCSKYRAVRKRMFQFNIYSLAAACLISPSKTSIRSSIYPPVTISRSFMSLHLHPFHRLTLIVFVSVTSSHSPICPSSSGVSFSNSLTLIPPQVPERAGGAGGASRAGGKGDDHQDHLPRGGLPGAVM